MNKTEKAIHEVRRNVRIAVKHGLYDDLADDGLEDIMFKYVADLLIAYKALCERVHETEHTEGSTTGIPFSDCTHDYCIGSWDVISRYEGLQ